MIRAKLSSEQQHNRAVNASVQLMQQRLIVPKIFVNAQWPNRNSRVDLLAVDRAGAGEIHVVQVFENISNDGLSKLFDVPAHYKYVGRMWKGNYRLKPESLYAKDGFGRVGVITFQESQGQDFRAILELRPERFNLSSSYFANIDRFTAKHRPDWEIRD